MESRIIIIDGNSLINRAYYAMQNPMITNEGIYTQGIYGFINMLTKIKKEHEAGYIVVTFDMKAPTFRHKEYKEYKAGRKKMPPELAMQLPILKEVLLAMNIKLLEMEGYEADDIIGTIAKKAESEDLNPLIITGDKDELQLATDITKVMITKKGISQFEIYDREKMIEKYGFTPEEFIDFKGLMGDPSDNIPGVPGVGEKTAQKLILEFGSVENVLENTDKLKGKIKENIEENATLALMSKKLATINTQVPIDMDFEEYKWEEADYKKLVDLYVKLEFNSFLKKMDSTIGNGKKDKKKEDVSEIEEIEYKKTLIENKAGIGQVREALKNTSAIIIKVFIDSSDKLNPFPVGMSLLIDNNYFYVDLNNKEILRDIASEIKEADAKIVGHDLKNDYHMLMNAGSKNFNTHFDTAIAEYLIDSGRSNYSLTTLAQEYFHFNLENEEKLEEGQMDLFENKVEKYSEYGLNWCKCVKQLMELQGKKIKEELLEEILNKVELPLIEVMAYMEYVGFSVDKEELNGLGKEMNIRIEELTKNIYQLAGEEFNIKSPKQLGPILFEKLQLTKGKKTKTGYSTGAEVLEKIKDEHEIIPLIIEYRMLTKLMGTYIDGLIPLVHEDGKIHAKFNQTIATTGRISSSDPNLQNIPIRQELGRQIRRGFVPSSDEYFLMGADYSQIELRVLAHMSDDEFLIESFNKGEDIHRGTAARVLGIPENEINMEQRSRAKAVNFGVIYGMSAFGLSTELNITRKEADEYINNYFEKHKAVKKFMDEQVKSCKENGFVTTIMGRKRHIKEINASNYMVRQMGERLAMNSPIQGSAADIIKMAMVNIYKALDGYKSRLILQVHDELIIETHKGEKTAVENLLMDAMEKAISLKVPLDVDLNEGKNWYELK